MLQKYKGAGDLCPVFFCHVDCQIALKVGYFRKRTYLSI